jgi:predicted ATPase/class 3 adenylate cyclase
VAELKPTARQSAGETIAFLFADLEGSTRLLARLGAERYGHVLTVYRALIIDAADAERGEIVDREGDGLFLAFPTAAGALRAAAAAQRSLHANDWPEGARVAARIGVHAGEVHRADDGLVGIDVHRAARVASAAHGGQVLVSEAAHQLAQDALPDELQLRDLGEHRLKDLARFERLHQLQIPGLPKDFPAPRTLDSRHHNLPVQATPFVGRQDELSQLIELVRSSRLVTITGVGGSGKTRLALQAAGEMVGDFADGVWLVELASVTDPDGVDGALLAALALTQNPGVGPRETILASLQGSAALVILDNCEHLLDAAADLAMTILTSAPAVRIVATSRELMGVAGESVYGLRSMSLPGAEQPEEPQALASYDAIKLFTERAAAVLPGFRLDAGNAPSVVEICLRLDGMPLALELAAPRLRTFSPQKLAALLDQRFRLLTGGSRTALPRQQTLGATIDWSYRLLAESERAFLRRLSVFVGGFSYEAGVAIGAGGEVDEVDVIELLPALIDKSLVVADGELGDVRYRLLETIRQFARERLDEGVEGESVRHKHAAHFHAFSLAAAREAVGPHERARRTDVRLESDNLRQAMTWLLETGEPVTALEAAIAFARFAGWSEARVWLGRAIDGAWPAAGKLLRARALSVRGQLRDRAGEFEEAAGDLRLSLKLFREVEASGADPVLLTEFPRYAGTLIALAVALFHQGQAGQNNALFTELVQQALAIARRLGDQHSIASALGNLAHHSDPTGDRETARRLFADAVAATRSLGSDQMMAVVSQQRAYFEFAAGNLEASRAAWKAAIEHAERAGEDADAHVLRAYLAATEVELGVDAAASFVASVRMLFGEPGTREAAWVFQALIVFRAGIDATRRDHRRVAVAAGASEAEVQRGASVRWDLVKHFDRTIGAARAALGDEQFRHVARQGAAMSRDEIAEFLTAD